VSPEFGGLRQLPRRRRSLGASISVTLSLTLAVLYCPRNSIHGIPLCYRVPETDYLPQHSYGKRYHPGGKSNTSVIGPTSTRMASLATAEENTPSEINALIHFLPAAFGMKKRDFTSVFQSASLTRRLKFKHQLAASINPREHCVGRCCIPRSSVHASISK